MHNCNSINKTKTEKLTMTALSWIMDSISVICGYVYFLETDFTLDMLPLFLTKNF